MSEKAGSITKDPRLDRVVTWALALLVSLALSIGAWFFSMMTSEIRGLRGEISNLRVSVALNSSLEKRINAIESRVDDHQRDSHASRHQEKIGDLADRIRRLEERK